MRQMVLLVNLLNIGGKDMKSYLYMNQVNRNAKARELQSRGFKVRKSSTRNQLLHPQYVEDYPRKLSTEDCGFGNTIYKTHFSVLYEVEVNPSW